MRRVAALFAVLAFLVPAAPASAAPPAYLSLSFGRTQYVSTENCVAPPGAITLDQVAQELAGRGLKGAGNVVVRMIAETERTCEAGALYPTWGDLARLRDDHGWTFVSAGQGYADMRSLSRAQQRAESCGSLRAFTAHGHNRAHGLFAYPNNSWSDAAQRDVVSTCFAYGRKYGDAANVRSTMAPPWFATVKSANGGRCASGNCPGTGSSRTYVDPGVLRHFVQVRSQEWRNLQMYKFVTDAQEGRWDCTSADWRDHWTSRPEEYCWQDYLSVLDAIPANAVVTDPLTVARAWSHWPRA